MGKIDDFLLGDHLSPERRKEVVAATNCSHAYMDDGFDCPFCLRDRLAQAESENAALKSRLAVRQTDIDLVRLVAEQYTPEVCDDCRGTGAIDRANDGRLISCESCGGHEDSLGCGVLLTEKNENDIAELIRAHVARETEPWRKRAEEAEVSLKKIANHPHCDYYHESNGATPYGTGCADGHRCAAQIANAYFATHPATGGGEE